MKTTTLAGLVLGLLVVLVPANARAVEPAGFIYGTVETSNGNTYKGFLRWGREEAFWGDHFNSTKKDLPYAERHKKEARQRNKIKIFGVTVGYRWDDVTVSRQFVARFGDIERVEIVRGDRIRVTTKDGVVHQLEGGSNDIGAQITVQDDSLGEVKLDWDKIETIVFSPAPPGASPKAYRIYGTLTAEDDTFEGFIQWDSEECLATDRLDGDAEDGDLSIEMGNIRSIEKRNNDGSWVELKDGRRILLEDSNDVDGSIRGIFVEDERYGRVKVSWGAFVRLDFREVGHSGPPYRSFEAEPLRGTVTDYDGKKVSGGIVFDLDESATWELLNGSLHDVEYSIPFGMIRSIEPQRGDASRVVLTSGVEVVLRDGNDVSEDNDGVVVVRDNEQEVYIPWAEIERIEFGDL